MNRLNCSPLKASRVPLATKSEHAAHIRGADGLKSLKSSIIRSARDSPTLPVLASFQKITSNHGSTESGADARNRFSNSIVSPRVPCSRLKLNH